jgi:hypothetical protein
MTPPDFIRIKSGFLSPSDPRFLKMFNGDYSKEKGKIIVGENE